MYDQNDASNLNTNIISNTTPSENLKILSDLTEAEAFSLESNKHLYSKSSIQPSSFKTYNLNEKNQTSSDFIQHEQSSSLSSKNYNNNSNYQQYGDRQGELELRARDTTNYKSSSNMYPK
jgi:hypothetical protein